jgi:general secretion pathway protein J
MAGLSHTRSPPGGGARGSAAGFTLIEILVALLILGIMSALGYNTYRAARISAERAEESMQRTRAIEFGMHMLVQDLAEVVPRPVRDSLGQSRLPALRGGANATSLVDLTRAGWSNTAGTQRSTLQRVSYQLVDDVLKRSYVTVLDATLSNQPVVQDVFTGVKSVQLHYLDANQNWSDVWPESTAAAAAPGATDPALVARPVAVEIIIEFKDWGRVRRLVEVAG